MALHTERFTWPGKPSPPQMSAAVVPHSHQHLCSFYSGVYSLCSCENSKPWLLCGCVCYASESYLDSIGGTAGMRGGAGGGLLSDFKELPCLELAASLYNPSSHSSTPLRQAWGEGCYFRPFSGSEGFSLCSEEHLLNN